MEHQLEQQMNGLRKHYRYTMAGILALAGFTLVVYFLYPELTNLSRVKALISKSVMIILFLSVVPLLLSYLRKRLARVPGETTPSEKMAIYKKHFRVKAMTLSVLCVLSMLVFILSDDPMILILLVAGILFLYFERPNELKFRNDLENEADGNHQ